MSSLFSSFLNLPPHLRIATAVFGGASLLAVAGMIAVSIGGSFLWILLIGGIVAALLVLAYRGWLKWREKRKAKPLEAGVVENSSAAPSGVSDPIRRANLDNLRKDFEEGMAKFRAAGKDLYSLPWYLLVGEPGSGKTEAVRHCNVGFPPGLQDPQQGAGGTLNMNWWFTNHAIIVDTAGRLMFEEVQAGATSEWKELLKLLSRARSRCPINGMLLVIPADSLLRDTSEQIEQKAGKIAQQLDGIQRTLDVRFPVFILVTKSDMITGFREFFDDLDNPQLQHQMLGWSNPAPIDDAFEPDKVDEHLRAVRGRLLRRRLALLLDPPEVVEHSSHRADQVSALYAFPDELLRIAPRLRRYLEMIFVAGEWSPKPLFLRGIYFTSSLQEGQELDAGLADLLGLSVAELPGESSMRQEKSYFLRDLFMDKVFPERGLVSRAKHADRHHRRNRRIVLGTGLGAAMLILLLTVWFAIRFHENIGRHEERWQAVASAYQGDELLVTEREKGLGVYREGPVAMGSEDIRPAESVQWSRELASQGLQIPLMFRFMEWFLGWFGATDLADKPFRAHAALVQGTTLRQVVSILNAEYLLGEQEWSAVDSHALVELVALARLATAANVGGEPPQSVQIEPLIDAALTSQERDKAAEDADTLQAAVDYLYANMGDEYRPFARTGDFTMLARTIRDGLERWKQHLGDSSGELGERQAALEQLVNGLSSFNDAEEKLLALHETPIASLSDFRRFESNWSDQMNRLREAEQSVGTALAALNVEPTESFAAIKQDQEQIKARILGALDRMRAMLPPSESEEGVDDGDLIERNLAELSITLRDLSDSVSGESFQTMDDLIAQLSDYDVDYLQPLESSQGSGRAFARRFAMYTSADEALSRDINGVTLATVGESLDAWEEARQSAVDAVRDQGPGGEPSERMGDAVALAEWTLTVADRRQRQAIYESALAAAPASGADVAELVRTFAVQREGDHRVWPTIPPENVPAGEPFDLRYDDAAAVRFLANWKIIVDDVNSAGSSAQKLVDHTALENLVARAQGPVQQYQAQFCGYWSEEVFQEASRFTASDWGEFHDLLKTLRTRDVNHGLRTLARRVLEVYDHAPTFSGWPEGFDRDLRSQLTDTLNDDRIFETTRRAWAGLPRDAIGARNEILSVSATDFGHEYLPLRYQDDRFALDYWNALVRTGLTLLVDSINELAANARQTLQQDRFVRAPLCRDCSRSISKGDMDDAQEALYQLVPPDIGQTVGAGHGDQGSMPHTNIADKLAQLASSSSLASFSESVQARLAGMRKIAEASSGSVRATIRPPSEAMIPAAAVWRTVVITVDGSEIAEWNRVGQSWQANSDSQQTIDIGHDSGIRFEFYTGRGGNADQGANGAHGQEVVALDQPYALISHLGGHGEPASVESTEKRHTANVWHLRLELPSLGNGDTTLTAIIEVELNKPLPVPADWPTESTWPLAASASP